MAVKLNSTGGGSVTLDSPSTASNYTVTLPSAAGTLATTTGTGSVFTNPTINGFTGDTSAITIGTTQFVKDTSGNVGIGETSPSSYGKLTVTDQAVPNGGTYLAVRGGYPGYAGAYGYGLKIYDKDNTTPYFIVGSDYTFTINKFTSSGTYTTALKLDNGGNLGIGGAAAGSRLTVQATSNYSDTYGLIQAYNTNVNPTDNASFTTKSYSGTGQFMQWQNYGMRIGSRITTNGGVGSLYFTVANDSAAMTLDASGCLGVGPGGTSPSSYGWITSIGSSITRPLGSFYSNTASDSAYPCIQIGKYANDSTTANLFVRFFYNNLTNGGGQINANGAGAAAFGAFSDSRLKENIAPLPDQLANICALKPSEFDYKDGSGHQIGFIAQEMQEVYPDVVGEGDDGMLTITGWSKTEARLVKAIQELSAQNNALEARLAQLEAK